MRTVWSPALLGILALAALALGCEAQAKATYIKGPDSDQWFEVECREEVHYCRTKAAELCPGGYVISDTESHLRMGQLAASMLVKCR